MKNIISAPPGPVQDTIYIPSSKSISNRMLVIHALSGADLLPDNLSDSDDTRLLREALGSSSHTRDVGHAGTAMRFLTAYFATGEREVILTGSARMKQRPIGPLVDALRELGAGIEYLEQEGSPPLRIPGGLKQGGKVVVNGGISSQFISALMMIGPVLEGGLHIVLQGDVVSATYIRMTLELMNRCGAGASFDGQEVHIPQRNYRAGPFTVESDWSAASYWYETAALLPGSVIRLPRLSDRSLQGDAELVSLFEPLGVRSEFDDRGVTLRSGHKVPGRKAIRDGFNRDLSGSPDLVQTLAATLCGLGIPFRLSGTRTLRVKETDRIAALQQELLKLGFGLSAGPEGDWLSWDGSQSRSGTSPEISTYNDHRMAMAFAPLSIPFGSLVIGDPGVVSKSYPRFWQDLEKAGFVLNSSDRASPGRIA